MSDILLHWNTIRSRENLSNCLPPLLLRNRSHSASTPPFNPTQVIIGSSSSSPFTSKATRETLGVFELKSSFVHTALKHFGVEVPAFSKQLKSTEMGTLLAHM